MSELLEVRLDDKYRLERGRVFVTGIQALVRLPLEQRRRDQAAGLSTAGFISGYRGSPLGGYDQQLQQAKRLLDEHHIVHQPGVNEDLAATAIQGSQQVGLAGESRYDGVFAIWYGKGPGVDRSGDAIRHGNLFGTAAHGGVLLLLGDDHICESSTTAHQSEYAMVDAMVPILNPSGVQEILDYGLHGIAMSRLSGAWVALKCIHDTVESTASIEVGPDRPTIRRPAGLDGPNRRNIEIVPEMPWPPMALEVEKRLHTERLAAARAYARANGIDRVVLGGTADDRLCVVTCGKSWQDVVAALDALGIDEPRARALGLRVYKPALVWPLEPAALREAVRGVRHLLVVEEKRPLVEDQIRQLLYDDPDRPAVEGKRASDGSELFPSYGQLEANGIALAIGRRLLEGREDAVLAAKLAALERLGRESPAGQPGMVRLPWFCPGCPHNTSTRVPAGSKATAGIGCHFMASWMDRATVGFTQMGGEGVSWLGQAPFSTRRHMFQNLGDGTFYHSGSLAIRAAKAAGANITFKILFNDAVAMTGGQKMETGNLTPLQIVDLLRAEGVSQIAVVADEPERYPALLAGGIEVHHRDELDALQLKMRELPGVSAILYDQTCAAEKRRRRKRGAYPDPDRRVLINELVCEGCGDCGVQSNCVAIQPVETELGRKRRIDQSACNKDFSCLKGFCPSFVTVHGAKIRKGGIARADGPFPVLPEPALPALDRTYGIVVTGIGGTGVITIGALLGMAAHLEGKGFVALDMVGLAQKGGAVVSHLKIAPTQATTGSPRVAAGGADLLLGCDLVVAAGRTALPTVRKGRTRIIANTEEVMTGAFTADPDLVYPAERLRRALRAAAGADAVELVDATRLATRLLGDGIAANLFLVGYAWQQGLIPLGEAAILRAIEINGVAVAFNRAAFAWGRRAAHDLAAVEAVVRAAEPPRTRTRTLDELIEHRAAFLTDYQDAAYADRYRSTVARVRAVEPRRVPGAEALTTAVARYLFKLMAYKDEYEVARLWSGAAFAQQLAAEFESWERLEFHLAPPALAERDPVTGHLKKRAFGPWMMRAFRQLAKLRRLRGTALDPFGRTAERRTERQLIADYERLIDEILAALSPDRHDLAVALASVPEQIRGYGHVKERHLAAARAREAELLTAFRAAPAQPQAAE